MAKPHVKDMTTGPVGKTLILFALPFFLSSLLQNIYNLVDTALAGHLYGDAALAAIGSTTSIFFLITMFANGLNSGFGIVLSRAFGSHDSDKFKRAAAAMLILNFSVNLLLAVFSCLGIGSILRLLNTPEEIFAQSKGYITIVLAALPITGAYNMQSAMLQSLGNSRTPLFFLAISSCLNVLLDLAFVLLLDLGVEGLALATVIAQLLSCILCFIHILRNYPQLHFSRSHIRYDRVLYKELISTGLSMSLMSTIFNLGSIFVQGAVNTLGTYAITAQTAARKLYSLMNMPQSSLSVALTTLVSQNYGAGKFDRCKTAWKLEVIFGLITSFTVILITNLFGPMLLKAVSGSSDPEVLKNAMMFLRFHTSGFPILTVLMGTRMFMQGVGSKIVPIVSSTIELIGKVAFTFLIIPYLGFLGVCIVEPSLWVICMLFLVFNFIRISRTLKEGASTI